MIDRSDKVKVVVKLSESHRRRPTGVMALQTPKMAAGHIRMVILKLDGMKWKNERYDDRKFACVWLERNGKLFKFLYIEKTFTKRARGIRL